MLDLLNESSAHECFNAIIFDSSDTSVPFEYSHLFLVCCCKLGGSLALCRGYHKLHSAVLSKSICTWRASEELSWILKQQPACWIATYVAPWFVIWWGQNLSFVSMLLNWVAFSEQMFSFTVIHNIESRKANFPISSHFV